jgi:galactonate dehydratase
VLEKRAASILQPDLSHAGGIFETRLIAGMAEAYYAGLAPHCPLGPIAFAACVQLDASIPNFLCQEGGRHATPAMDGYLKIPFRHENGYLPLPTAPGLGIELDHDALQDKIGHDWQNPKAWGEDGSAIDW